MPSGEACRAQKAPMAWQQTEQAPAVAVSVVYARVSSMNSEVSERSTVVRSGSQVSSDLGGEVAVLDFAAGLYYGLDAVGARIWDLVQEPKSVKEIQVTVVEEYDVEPARAERDVLMFLQRLADAGLIEVRA